MYRSHTCGELRPTDKAKTVTLSGWVHTRRDHGGLIFFDLRDRYGITQVTFDPKRSPDAFQTAEKVRSEYVVKISGTVVARPKNMVNPKLATGEIEVQASAMEILNAAKTPPFEIADESSAEVNEEVRLKYRFLDLRRRRMQQNLEFRATVTQFIRTWCARNDFVEVDTPLLTVSSPEGARDFLVPSRLHPGKFYALPQAPQQYKQLLMVAGLDRYFQIAPCLRDEDARADRSPGEFYQLDVETSFLEQDEFFALMEPLFIELTETLTKKRVQSKPFLRIPYKEALAKYGTDKPDLRYGLEIQDVTALVKDSGFSVFADAVKKGGVVRTITATGAAGFSRSVIDRLTEFVREKGASGLAYITVKNGKAESPIVKHLGEDLAEKLMAAVGARSGDMIFFGAGDEALVASTLGALRGRLAAELELINPAVMAFCWIVDFPMYERNPDTKKIEFSHNPFSMPQGGMAALESKNPLDILAYQYDIVCNGVELSSGAVRNNVPEVMYKAFEIAGYSKKEVDAKFGHMISAFSYGAPPHAGFAPGIERLVMLLRDEPNIREVTAFPKNSKAEDVMMGAPSEVDPKQLRELHIKLAK
ncbi:MAG: aspartate--tRNA ligase [Candidatus Kerfeldbacteria bacterium]|nr:aspartate--tRNA ligase [Candidatus Kerfeldbacteria bacterium]